MSSFSNPTNSQDDVYITEELRQKISGSSSVYEELKFRPKNVLDFVEDSNHSEYISQPQTHTFNEYNQSLATEIDSFTAPEIVSTIIDESEITDIETDPEKGLFHVNTYKTAEMDNGWTFWVPFVDDSSGEIIGQVEDPYTEDIRSFSHSIEDPISAKACRDRNIGQAIYTLARETIPEGPKVQRRTSTGQKVNEDYLIAQFDIFEGNLGIISELEESGQYQVSDNNYSSSNGQRGGEVTKGVRNFFNMAKDARVIDYTVSNDNKENILKIENGGYKNLTRNISQLGFSSPQDLISSRTAPSWNTNK